MAEPMFRGRLAGLSNFDTTPFEVPGLGTVASAEHAFNALKSLDAGERAWVLSASTPGEAKRRGRRVSLRPGWDTGVRVLAMQEILGRKFAVPSLAALLTSTGTRRLTETNDWHDQFWGDCYCPRHQAVPGVNLLGELLMALRVQLQT